MPGSSEQDGNEGKCQAGPGEASIDRFRGDRQAAEQIADTHSSEVGAGLLTGSWAAPNRGYEFRPGRSDLLPATSRVGGPPG